MKFHVCADYPDGHAARGSCVKCGKLMPPPTRLSAPRWDLCDPDFETEATLTAARQAGVNGTHLDNFARARKTPGPVREHVSRNFRLEVAEELADARNYLVWWMEQLREHGDLTVQAQWHLMEALGAVAVAYHHALGGIE